jgi:hypothetical protein
VIDSATTVIDRDPVTQTLTGRGQYLNLFVDGNVSIPSVAAAFR